MNDNQPVTRGEFKTEMESVRSDIINAVNFSMKIETDAIKQDMMTKTDKQEILSRFDAFAQRSEDHDNKVLFHHRRITDLETKAADHETRLTRLESPK